MKPDDETKRFWLMLYAGQAFRDVIKLCEYLLEKQSVLLRNDESLFRWMATAMFTIYGRPFSTNYGVRRLDAQLFVPREYTALHKKLICERNKIHAHKDAKGLATRIGNANQVRIVRAKNGFAWAIPTHFSYEEKDLRDVSKLCEALIEKLNYHIDKYERKCRKEIKKLREGEYLLNVDDTEEVLFVKAPNVEYPVPVFKMTPI